MKRIHPIIIILSVASLLALEIQLSSLSMLKAEEIENDACLPYSAHLELGTSFQLNKYVNRNQSKFDASNEFVIAYQTKGNNCQYGQDIDITVNPYVKLLRVSNYTSAPDNSTINCAKYGIATQKDISYSFNSSPLQTHKIIIPYLFENQESSYKLCLFNQVQDLSSSDCNIAQFFHYSLEEPYNFFTNGKFFDFISSHVIHLISIFSTFDADLAPFGSKQYYFNFNFMFTMTLDISEEDSQSLLLSMFNDAVPTAQENRADRPWFVAFANNSPYILSQSGVTLDSKYAKIYDRINQAGFDVLLTSSANSESLKIYQGSFNNTIFNEISQKTQLNSKNGLIIVEIPTQSTTPIIIETSFYDFKVIENNNVRLVVNQA